MELSERCIATLEHEGFATIYEEKYAPDTMLPVFPLGAALMVSEGALMVVNGVPTTLLPGERYRYRTETQLIAGPSGCQLVIGESTGD